MDFCECARRAAPRVRARGVHCARCSLLNEGSDTGGPFLPGSWPSPPSGFGFGLCSMLPQQSRTFMRAAALGDSIQCCVFRDQTGRTGDPCSRRSRRLSARASRLVLGTSFSHAITHPTAAAPRFHAGQPSASTCRTCSNGHVFRLHAQGYCKVRRIPSAIDENPCSKTKRGVYLTCC
jgi:hypothetical protein